MLNRLSALLAFAFIGTPLVAQEPVVAVADPQRLVDDDPALHANKQLAALHARALAMQPLGARAGVAQQTLLQHNPNGRSGRDGIMTFFTRTRQRTENCSKLATPLVAVADGDLVTVVLQREYDHPARSGEKYTSTWFYLWRVVDGKLDEHWAPTTSPCPDRHAVRALRRMQAKRPSQFAGRDGNFLRPRVPKAARSFA